MDVLLSRGVPDSQQVHHRPRSARAGFSLVELLIALLIGGALSAVLLQLLVVETGSSQTLGRLLRERQLGQRALELVRQELQQAHWVSTAHTVPAPCSLAGRTVVLQLATPAGLITYSIGAAPSPIWRGRVLMRCGPAYGLAGELASGQPQNRVLIDALVPGAGFAAAPQAAGVLRLRLARQFSAASPLVLELPAAAGLQQGA
ncbi:MAG: prepilin-type N-terminal cleavage/methylation domain-containing protein [Cyanobacteriota bacterium]|nr:prepilin-type N-terminal cleavage/methylation domain-containing protein [Cyanobacteriota bacterium]